MFSVIRPYLDWSSCLVHTHNLLMNTDQGAHKASSMFLWLTDFRLFCCYYYFYVIIVIFILCMFLDM
jgi:hypothetical protein